MTKKSGQNGITRRGRLRYKIFLPRRLLARIIHEITGTPSPNFLASPLSVANFAQSKIQPLQNVRKQYVQLCRSMGMLNDDFVAIDGSKFKAVNSRDKNFIKAKMKRRLE